MHEFETTVNLEGIGTITICDYNLDTTDLQVEGFDAFLDQLVPNNIYDLNVKKEFRDKFGKTIDDKYTNGEEITLRGLIETMHEIEASIEQTEAFDQTRRKIYTNISNLATALVLNSNPEIAKSAAYFQAEIVFLNIKKLLED